jgi:hypothetical protein
MINEIKHLFPNADPLVDFELRDNSDGKGPYIARWDIAKLGTQPTAAQLQEVASAAALTQAKTKQITLLEAAYTAAIQLPVDYMATTFQADVASQDVLAKSLVSGKVPTGFYWLDSANAKVAMTFVQAQDLAYAMLVHGMTAFAKLQDKKTAVRAATTVADVLAVTL